MTPSSDLIGKLDRDGFAIVRSVLSDDLRFELLRALEKSLSPSLAGVRGLVKKIPVAGHLASSPMIRALVEPVLGTNAVLVRSILFNKSEAANWQVAWHQDLAIAVQQKVGLEGFVSWSRKEGVPHVQPPVEVLERMLNVRVHLDAADKSNGALLVSPGSHRLGRIPADEAAATAKRLGSELCSVNAGDVLLFRPLTLHASRKVTSNRPRRVIHLEFAGVSLPAPLAWAETVA
jgi:ectoine hydroxylase-related dioxygenase (phytanoyl-CoA dioxygenase family)